QEVERGLGVETLELTERDVPPRTLAMGLKIGREDREAGSMKEARSRQHARAIAAHAVQEQNGARADSAGAEPRPNRAARPAREVDGLCRETRRRPSDDCARRACKQAGLTAD